jgi:NACHT domain
MLVITINCVVVQVHRLGTASIFDMLKTHIATNAAYNSRERELEHALICQKGTRDEVLANLSAWAGGNPEHPVCWLEGPAGSGKSTIANTIAQQYDHHGNDKQPVLAFGFSFSRGKADRSDTIKFVPTFAYQLTKALPGVEPHILSSLMNEQSIADLRLQDQIMKLIINPIIGFQNQHTIPPMIIVVDGLDECSDDDGLQKLIQLLIRITDHISSFRLLFTSRPESHIQQIFEIASITDKVYSLSLRDFDACNDISNYLQLEISQIRQRNDALMRDVPHPWPSRQELEVLVKQSDGLFIYASTLVKFVADKKGLPQEKLQVAMTTHRGVDPLYDQVLSAAQSFDYFEQVVGTIIYLRYSLTVNELGGLLQLSSSCIRQGLRGCQSIFAIPDTDQEPVHPYHASLRDFLMDQNRAKAHFLDPQKFRISILVCCLRLIGMNENYPEDDKHLRYACKNWCYHLSDAFSHQVTIDMINAHWLQQYGDLDLVTAMKRMECHWLRTWMCGVGSVDDLLNVHQDCGFAIDKIEVCCFYYYDFKILILYRSQLWDKKS